MSPAGYDYQKKSKYERDITTEAILGSLPLPILVEIGECLVPVEAR